MRRYVSGSRDRGGRGKASAPSVWYQLTRSAGKQRSAVGKGKISFSFVFVLSLSSCLLSPPICYWCEGVSQ